ncbi:acyltransferase [Ignatzschineria sp. LJL83]
MNTSIIFENNITFDWQINLEVHETIGGKNNLIIIGGNFPKSCKLKVIFTGSHSTLYLGDNCNFRGSIRIDTKGSVKIGKNFRSTNNISLLCRPNKEIVIGDNCLFATGIVVRTSDEHSILCKDTRKILNPNKSVYISDRVWVCDDVIVLKGTKISSDTVIGAGTVVTGTIDSHLIVAGNPCRIVKTGIIWTYDKPM